MMHGPINIRPPKYVRSDFLKTSEQTHFKLLITPETIIWGREKNEREGERGGRI